MFGAGPGTIVEVGAFDGVRYSNSYLLEQKGWCCVLIEPNPELCKQIANIRRSQVFNCAAGATSSKLMLSFQRGKEEYAFTTGDPALVSRTEEVGLVEMVEVYQRKLDDICAEAQIGQIDILTIDVEGNEMAVLAGFDIKRWRPKLILVEDNQSFQDRTIEKYLKAQGYFPFKRTGVNDWYTSKASGIELTYLEKLTYLGCRFRAWCRHRTPRAALGLFRRLRRNI